MIMVELIVVTYREDSRKTARIFAKRHDAVIEFHEEGNEADAMFVANTDFEIEPNARIKELEEKNANLEKIIGERNHRACTCQVCGATRGVGISWIFDAWICDTCMDKQLDNFVIHRDLKRQLVAQKALNKQLMEQLNAANVRIKSADKIDVKIIEARQEAEKQQ